MLIPSADIANVADFSSLSRRVNANSQLFQMQVQPGGKLIKKGEC